MFHRLFDQLRANCRDLSHIRFAVGARWQAQKAFREIIEILNKVEVIQSLTFEESTRLDESSMGPPRDLVSKKSISLVSIPGSEDPDGFSDVRYATQSLRNRMGEQVPCQLNYHANYRIETRNTIMTDQQDLVGLAVEYCPPDGKSFRHYQGLFCRISIPTARDTHSTSPDRD